MSRAAVIGFFGKIPTRGDFVQAGLPRSFIDPWDDWMQDRLAASKQRLGEDWLDLWMEAPIWQFRLGAGMCGTDAVSGLWLPSVDRVGRHFPLTLAALDVGTDWLAAAEAIGLAVLEDDLPPEQITARLHALPLNPPVDAVGGTIWWTQGAPRVAASSRRFTAMPSREDFAAMLQDLP